MDEELIQVHETVAGNEVLSETIETVKMTLEDGSHLKIRTHLRAIGDRWYEIYRLVKSGAENYGSIHFSLNEAEAEKFEQEWNSKWWSKVPNPSQNGSRFGGGFLKRIKRFFGLK